MSCPVCKSPDSNSPTGSWCNTCGYQSPCPCWKGDAKSCMDFMNEKRMKSGYRPLAEKCCCNICELRPDHPERKNAPTPAPELPGSTLKVMRGPGGGLYLSGVEDLREGDVFRREVRE